MRAGAKPVNLLATEHIAALNDGDKTNRCHLPGMNALLLPCCMACLAGPLDAAVTATILAGGETDQPADTPSRRVDAEGTFPFVGALEVSAGGGGTFRGSAVALSTEWVLTAGHNADLDDNGLPDAGWRGTFHLPGYGSFAVAEAFIHPDFTGFASPSVNDDLALLRLAVPLPAELVYPGLGTTGVGNTIVLVGFGRSGYGSYGYTTNASSTDRRFGSNVIDRLAWDDEDSGVAEVFRYDFDNPSTTGLPGGSLGNAIETIIGPGDSGGPALVWMEDGWVVVGINTFTEGYGGRFGDTGGGVLVEPYREWIRETMAIPEPAIPVLLALAGGAALLARKVRRSG